MVSSIRDVVVLSWSTPTTASLRAEKIAAFLGAEVTSVALTAANLHDGQSFRQLIPACACLIVDAETLAKAADAMPGGTKGLPSLIADAAEHAFVYGFQRTDSHDAILRVLSSGGVLGVQPLSEEASFQVADGSRQWCGQFSGLSLGVSDTANDSHFVQGADGAQAPIIRVGGKPCLIRTMLNGAEVFLSASAQLADLDEKVGRQARPLTWFSRLMPLMMFLRGALGSRVWHNDNPRACFIIDDPWLRNDRYGFLEYEQLVATMRRLEFSTCIAFIPWNYRRSSRRVARLFSSRDGAPSLCIHGYDHTRGEFLGNQFDVLSGKARAALERMRRHSELSGIPFDDVMVFPQGLFSTEAISALKAAGYLAAVNSNPVPTTLRDGLLLRDLLEVAVTRFGDFPVFGRRYPRDLGEFAFDLFMGRPALAGEHHGYFRNGCADLESFVERLNGLDERLEWTDLGTICSRTSLTRTDEDGNVRIRFYTDRFSLANNGTRARDYLLVRRQTADQRMPLVTIDGREWSSTRENGQLQIGLSLTSGQTADVRLVSGESDADMAGPRWRETMVQNTKVLIRRHLSDFRDNWVDTSRVLSAIAPARRN